MVKYFCDHCGKEIHGNEINELDEEDCFYDHFDTKKLVGFGAILCPDCLDKRIQEHIQLDLNFLNIHGDKNS